MIKSDQLHRTWGYPTFRQTQMAGECPLTPPPAPLLVAAPARLPVDAPSRMGPL